MCMYRTCMCIWMGFVRVWVWVCVFLYASVYVLHVVSVYRFNIDESWNNVFGHGVRHAGRPVKSLPATCGRNVKRSVNKCRGVDAPVFAELKSRSYMQYHHGNFHLMQVGNERPIMLLVRGEEVRRYPYRRRSGKADKATPPLPPPTGSAWFCRDEGGERCWSG